MRVMHAAHFIARMNDGGSRLAAVIGARVKMFQAVNRNAAERAGRCSSCESLSTRSKCESLIHITKMFELLHIAA
jgi:hypothetical protein